MVATLVALGIAVTLAGPTLGGAKNAWVMPPVPAAEDHDDPIDCLLTLLAPGVANGDNAEPQEDVYCFVLLPGQAAHIEVDTRTPRGAGDMWSCAGTTVNVATCTAFGDDNMPCTFPPPVFSCPSYNYAPQQPKVPPIYYVIVGSFNFGFTPLAEYELSVAVGGAAIGVHQVIDNRANQGP